MLLPDSVAREAKKLALDKGCIFRDLVLTGLQREPREAEGKCIYDCGTFEGGRAKELLKRGRSRSLCGGGAKRLGDVGPHPPRFLKAACSDKGEGILEPESFHLPVGGLFKRREGRQTLAFNG